MMVASVFSHLTLSASGPHNTRRSAATPPFGSPSPSRHASKIPSARKEETDNLKDWPQPILIVSFIENHPGLK
jgi:hypothetical protein